MSLVKEFKEFAMRGNVVDMAVGIIIGAAFGKITTSLVNDVLMPPIGELLSGIDFKDLKIDLNHPLGGEPVAINYGNFITTIIDFFIVAVAVFFLIKAVNSFKRKEVPAAPTTKVCPECLSTIPLGATRCAFCTASLTPHP